MAASSSIDLLSHKRQRAVANTISERFSEELIIALVGPVGSGVTTCATYISDILKQEFDYNVCPIIKPSDIILAECHRVGISAPSRDPLDKYITEMQAAGNKLREVFGSNYLAEKIVEKIYKFREANGGFVNDIPLPGRRAYIIDSLKNPEELDLLRLIYGEMICVFGVFAPDGKRSGRLQDMGIPTSAISSIMDRDQGEVATFGQKTRKLFTESDFFICNDQRTDDLRHRVKRYLEIIFNTQIHTPMRQESAMYEASSASANSACMSRQVGAAIVSNTGELISVGWNDVPRFGGGLYNEDDRNEIDLEIGLVDSDNRCFKWGGNICHNETRRNKILEDIAGRIASAKVLKNGKGYADIMKLLSGTGIDSLIEFSRSIHAEMEAILSVAREGRHSLIGSTLYTNTYPCHNCARHIVAAGIDKVIYIEPYLKSLAVTLHSDAVTEDPSEKSKVVFRQYDGVAPRHYLRLFRPNSERKQDGRVFKPTPKLAVPVFREPLDAPTNYEAKVIAELSEKEHTPT